MNGNPRERWFTGQLADTGKSLPPIEVDGAGWEADISEDQCFTGSFASTGQVLPALEVDGSAWDREPAVWLELVVSFEAHTPPAQVMQHVHRLLTIFDDAAPELGLAYDVRRSRSEGEQVVLVLTPRNAAGAEQRLQAILAAVNPELNRLAGPNRTVVRLVRGAAA